MFCSIYSLSGWGRCCWTRRLCRRSLWAARLSAGEIVEELIGLAGEDSSIGLRFARLGPKESKTIFNICNLFFSALFFYCERELTVGEMEIRL